MIALAGGVVAGFGVVAYYEALKRGPASVLAPLAASGLILPVFAGVARGERTVALAAVGLAVLLAGVTLLARQDAGRGVGVERVALGLGISAAVAFGGYFLVVDLAVGAGSANPLWIGGIVGVGSALAALPVLVWTKRHLAFRLEGPGLAGILAVGGLLAVADLALVAAMAGGDVALVAVVASSDPALTVVAARLALAERVSGRQAGGIALALAGLLSVAAA